MGDLIAVEAGDQVVVDGRLADGRMEVDESLLTGESDLVTKRPGDARLLGQLRRVRARPVRGRDGRRAPAWPVASPSGARTFRRTLTPLQREIQAVIRVTLGIVLYLQLLLIVKNVLLDVPLDEAVIEATVLVGLIPNGLFVSIAIAYALAAVRMSRVGALVQQANAVESLSHVDMLCVDKTGTLTANQLDLEAILPLDGDEAAARASVALMVASSSALNKTSEAIAAAVPSGRPAPATGRGALLLGAQVERRLPSGGRRSRWARRWHVRHRGADLPAPLPLRQRARSGVTSRRLVAHHAAQGKRVLLAACSPDTTSLRDEGDASVLPDDCRPYALIVLRDVLRRDAAETLERFRGPGRGRARHLRGRPGHRGHAGSPGGPGHESAASSPVPSWRRIDEDQFQRRGRADRDLRPHHARAQGAARGHVPRPGPLRGHDR